MPGIETIQGFCAASRSRYLLTVADTTHRRIAEMMEFLENERRALAAEVHDELAQNLSALHIQLAGLRSEDPKVQEATDLARQLVEGATALMASLRNPLAEGIDLICALKSLISNFSVECEAEIRVDWPQESPALSDLASLVLYRVLQEGLTNIRKHAQASLVTLEFRQSGTHLEVTLCDNGEGFEPQEWLKPRTAQKHFGLLSIRDRAEMVGGSATLKLRPRETTLVLTLPNRLDGGSDGVE